MVKEYNLLSLLSKVRWGGDGGVWRCGGEEMRRCGGEEMRR